MISIKPGKYIVGKTHLLKAAIYVKLPGCD
jgi:hypothetical protein